MRPLTRLIQFFLFALINRTIKIIPTRRRVIHHDPKWIWSCLLRVFDKKTTIANVKRHHCTSSSHERKECVHIEMMFLSFLRCIVHIVVISTQHSPSWAKTALSAISSRHSQTLTHTKVQRYKHLEKHVWDHNIASTAVSWVDYAQRVLYVNRECLP